MAAKNTALKFQNHYKKLPIRFVIYADFECFTKPLSTCEPYPHDSYTYSNQKHEPSGFCLYLKGHDGINKLFNPIIHTKQLDNEDIASIFVSKPQAITNRFTRITTRNQNLLNSQNKNKRSLIKLNLVTFAIKNYTMMIQQAKCLKSVTIVTSLESIVEPHITHTTYNVGNQ